MSAWEGDALSITVQNPHNSSDRDTLLLTLKDATHAQLRQAGIPVPPLELVRTDRPHFVATDWEESQTYSPDDVQSNNPEMKRIFDEDQRAREPGIKIDWSVVGKSDAERRSAVTKLLNDGRLHTGEDFIWAAFVFQHGSSSNDYLLAHTLAMIAVKKGDGAALWIATATLDRYLQSIHQPQIYGTQFLTKDHQPTTQEPYNRTLISDALRRQLGVPTQSAQSEQREEYDTERGIAK